nr:hypothetical protein OG409_12590 [Streptomyces sp. NBC_00974]
MRLRTTATALVGALALVLPTAGLSYAGDHDDRENLGTLHYRYTDREGERTGGEIRPSDNDTCYRLTHTSENRPAFEVKNETESLAVLYRDEDCGGSAEAVLEPGERIHGVEVASAYLKPTDGDGRHEGRHEGRHDERDDNEGRHEGRHEGRGDQEGRGEHEERGDNDGRSDASDEDRAGGRGVVKQGQGKARDFFDSVFRSIG